MQVSRKQKTFSEFFVAFFKCTLNIERFQKKGCVSYLIYFRNYGLRNTWLDQCRKSSSSRDPSESNMVNTPKHCSNLHGSTFTIFIDLCEGNWLDNKSLLVICKISTLFPNTLSADGKYSLLNRDNLTQPIQMQLSRKQKTFS